MLLRGSSGGGVAETFIQILKTVVPIGDVVLDRSVPTPFPSACTLGNIDNCLYIFL